MEKFPKRTRKKDILTTHNERMLNAQMKNKACEDHLKTTIEHLNSQCTKAVARLNLDIHNYYHTEALSRMKESRRLKMNNISKRSSTTSSMVSLRSSWPLLEKFKKAPETTTVTLYKLKEGELVEKKKLTPEEEKIMRETNFMTNFSSLRTNQLDTFNKLQMVQEENKNVEKLDKFDILRGKFKPDRLTKKKRKNKLQVNLGSVEEEKEDDNFED